MEAYDSSFYKCTVYADIRRGSGGSFGKTSVSMTPHTIREKISLGMIIVWLSKFPVRKFFYPSYFFQACLYRSHCSESYLQ